MPHTFSPTVSTHPDRATPPARPSQFLLATLVEPRPGMTMGSLSFMGFWSPMTVSRLTLVKMACSLSAGTPCAPTAVPMMLKWEKSMG
jgi:hypothetical protein